MKAYLVAPLAPLLLATCITVSADTCHIHNSDNQMIYPPVEYVKPSSTESLKPERKIKELFDLQYDNDYTIQKIGDQTYWIGVQYYNATVVINDEGVLVIDPLGPGDQVKALFNAIQSITQHNPKPITAIIYSHYHLDHIGGTNELIKLNNEKFPDQANKKTRIISSKSVAKEIVKHASINEDGSFTPKVTTPTETFTKRKYITYFGDQKLMLRNLKGDGHTPDNTLILLKNDRVLHFADMINPDQLPFYNFAGAENFPHGYVCDLKRLVDSKLGPKWDFINGGHGNIGSKNDIHKLLDYIRDLTKITGEVLNEKEYITSKSDRNHFIWFKNWQNSITKEVKNRLRERYGNMYGFDSGVVETHAAMVLGNMLDH